MSQSSKLVSDKLTGVVRDRVFVLLSLRPQDQKFIENWADGLHETIERRKEEGKIK